MDTAFSPLGALIATARAGCDWIASLPDGTYAATVGSPGATLGAHFRHHLDYLEALARGLPAGTIDYDDRARDARCETDRDYAIARSRRLEGLLAALAESSDAYGSRTVQVRECCDPESSPEWLASSVAREVQAVLSHSVHHFAILVALGRAAGLTADAAPSLAPSTRRHRDKASAALATPG